MNKDMRKIVKALEQQGYDVTITRKGHILVRLNGERITTLSGTPSDWRSNRNGMARLKAAGFQWPPLRR